jgi:hypothetical protein
MAARNQYSGLKDSVLSCKNTLRTLIETVERDTQCPQCMVDMWTRLDRISERAHEVSWEAVYSMWCNIRAIDFVAVVDELAEHPSLSETETWLFMREYWSIIYHSMLSCRKTAMSVSATLPKSSIAEIEELVEHISGYSELMENFVRDA